MLVLFALLALCAGYGLGSLPLGGRWVALLSGQNPRDDERAQSGCRKPAAFCRGTCPRSGRFYSTRLRGFSPSPCLPGTRGPRSGVYAGHLYPLPLWRGELPRGRGNGVLLGILAGLWAYGGVPFVLTLLPVVVYAALLSWRKYVSLATTVGLLSLPLLMLGAPTVSGYLPVALGAALLGVWRQKVSLARILDGTEARLGDPAACARRRSARGLRRVYDSSAEAGRCLAVAQRPVGSGRWYAVVYYPNRSFGFRSGGCAHSCAAIIRGVTLSDGRELRVMLIGGPMLPDQIRRYPDEALRMATQGARLAYELGG